MNNNQIVKILETNRNEKLTYLSTIKLTEEFEKEYKNMLPHFHLFEDIDREMMQQLEMYAKDKSINDIPQKYIEQFELIDREKNKENFKSQIKNFLNFLTEKYPTAETVLIEYDDEKATVTGFTKQNISNIVEARYINKEINWNEELFNSEPIFNFSSIWLDVEELEFTTICLDIYYQMQKLFQIESFIILHEAFVEVNQEMSSSEKFQNEIQFFINEHDCETYQLYDFITQN